MTKSFEVEVRGPLSESDFSRLKKFMEDNAEFLHKRNRLNVLYFRHGVPKHVNELKDEMVDLRLRTTGKGAELVMKYGSWGAADSRKEISFDFPLSKFGDMVELLKNLGWTSTTAYATQIMVYGYKGIEFSLVHVEDYGYIFEAEIMSTMEDAEKNKSRIIAVCKELGIRPFTEEEFAEECNRRNNMKGLQFNFSKDSFQDFRKKFSEFLS